MEKTQKKSIQSRVARLEDAVWSLLQLNRLYSSETDSLRKKIERLESSPSSGIPDLDQRVAKCIAPRNLCTFLT